MKRFAPIILVLALGVSGCTFSIAKMIKSANDVNVIADRAVNFCELVYKEAQQQCLQADAPEQCVEDVRLKFEPLWEAYAAYRKAWFELEEILSEQDYGRVIPFAQEVVKSEKQLERIIGDTIGPVALDGIPRK